MNSLLLKSKMVAHGDEDCVNALAKLLHISRTTASGKLNGTIDFKQSEMVTLRKKYNLNPIEFFEIFSGVEEDESQ